MVPMIIVAKPNTISGTKTPLTGSLIKRSDCRGYTRYTDSVASQNSRGSLTEELQHESRTIEAKDCHVDKEEDSLDDDQSMKTVSNAGECNVHCASPHSWMGIYWFRSVWKSISKNLPIGNLKQEWERNGLRNPANKTNSLPGPTMDPTSQMTNRSCSLGEDGGVQMCRNMVFSCHERHSESKWERIWRQPRRGWREKKWMLEYDALRQVKLRPRED
jgi:hypothetical protein